MVSMGMGKQQPRRRAAVKDFFKQFIISDEGIGIGKIASQIDENTFSSAADFGTATTDIVGTPIDSQSCHGSISLFVLREQNAALAQIIIIFPL